MIPTVPAPRRLPAVVFLAALAAACARGDTAWTPADPAMMKPVDELVAESQDVGAIKSLDADAHVVRVNPVAWATWELSDKQTFTATLAIYCDQHGSVHGKYVDIIDDETGRKVGHYGPSGFEVY